MDVDKFEAFLKLMDGDLQGEFALDRRRDAREGVLECFNMAR